MTDDVAETDPMVKAFDDATYAMVQFAEAGWAAIQRLNQIDPFVVASIFSAGWQAGNQMEVR